MLNPSTRSCAIALAATFIASVLSGCIGELGSVLTESEESGPTSGAGAGSDNGPPGGGPTTGTGGSTAAGSGASDGSGGSPAGGSAGSTTAGTGGSGGSTTAGTGGSDGSTTAGTGGSGGSPAGGTGGSDGSTTAGTGGSGGSPAGTGGSGGGGNGGSGGGGSTGAAQLCVDTINQHRATLGLPPLARWSEEESCSDGESESDGNANKPHGAFGKCGERAQNECPGWGGPPESMIVPCLQLMWDEGPGEDFNAHGHYLNMSNTEYTKVACGFHTFPDGSVWAVQNFR
ncbi:CAP domain-containing protein [Sorangium sp. So ce887]|uniref:CAP domain-containing protein n=1 Tax=Sorangium sp. So ce887 TaxID=3133324 RepID=UPI003F6001EE